MPGIESNSEESLATSNEVTGVDGNSSLAWIRIVSLLPLVILAIAWICSQTIRETLGEGLSLLWQRDLPGVRSWASELGWWAPAVTGVLMLIQAIAAPVPAFLVTAANSFLFGPFWGGIFSIVTANLAAACCYGIGRGYGTMVVDKLVSSETVDKYQTFFTRHGMLTVLIARLIPVVPFDPISYVAGIVRMPFWSFFWATMLGQVPAGMAYSYLVQQVDDPNTFAISLVCLLVVLILLGLMVKRMHAGKESSVANVTETDRPD